MHKLLPIANLKTYPSIESGISMGQLSDQIKTDQDNKVSVSNDSNGNITNYVVVKTARQVHQPQFLQSPRALKLLEIIQPI